MSIFGTSPDNVGWILDAMLWSLCRSDQWQALALRLNECSFCRIFHKNLHYHPYKIQVAKQLSERYKVSQLQFCNEFLDLVKNNSNILNTLLSDEAHFHVSGYVNKQNCCYWALNNPHELYQCPLHSAKWHCGVKFILMGLSILIFSKTWTGVQALCMQSSTKSC